MDGAIRLYKQAFKMWPALDSVTVGGLPRGVRDEAFNAGLSAMLLPSISVPMARLSRVVRQQSLLKAEDIAEIEDLRGRVLEVEQLAVNNPENAGHHAKVCVFLNNPPRFPAMETPESRAVIEKMLRFARGAWLQEDWSGDAGGLEGLHGLCFESLSIRVVEHWTYTEGGGLTDPLHYDVDSVLTIVALLHDDFEGGVFRTNEADGTHAEHAMVKGDAIVFLSHKYHNITPLMRGMRKSLVIELWQGGTGHAGR